MSTTHPAPHSAPHPAAHSPEHSVLPPPAAGQGPLREPARRLSPTPQGNRTVRAVITLLGAAVLLFVVLGLAAVSVSSWLSARGFSDIPATTELGTPTSLALSTDVGEVRVLHSTEVDQVTLALVENGSTALPAAGSQVRAYIEERGDAGESEVEVRQPSGPTVVPWEEERHELLLLIPDDLDLALEVSSDVGDLTIDGEFTSLSAQSDVGAVRLNSITAPGGLTVDSNLGEVEIELEGPAPDFVEVTTSLGTVDLLLPMDASGDVSVSSEMGNIEITAPGSSRWIIDADSDLGERTVDPNLSNSAGEPVGTLTAFSELGDVTISR